MVGERAPARLEFPRPQVLGRVAQHACLVQLRGNHIVLEVLVRRRQANAALRPVDGLEAGVAPRRVVVSHGPPLADRVPHTRVGAGQRLRAERCDHQRLEHADVAPGTLGPACRQVKIDIARGGHGWAAGVETFEARLQVLIDRVVLADRVDVSEVEVGREPWRFVVGDPDRD